MTDTVEKRLVLPFDALRTLHEGGSEVRVYRNGVTDLRYVGKRVGTFGLDGAMVVEEATRLSRIRHDHVVPVFSVATVEGYSSSLGMIEMVMPYYELGSVSDALIRGEAFTPARARDLTVAALLGLAELHDTERLVHRDFKSPNAFLTGDGHLLRVGDLGIAAPMDDQGTVEPFPVAQLYSPPEAFARERIDRRADLYSAGLMLHELLSGPLPWAEYDDRLSIAMRLGRGLSAVLPRHLAQAPWASPDLRRVVTKAVRADPDRRYPTAGSMAAALTSARIVDWRPDDLTADGGGRWTGTPVGGSGREYRVTIVAGKRSGWRVQAEQRVTTWRRCTEDAVLDAPRGGQATAFFDQIVAIAFRR